VSPTAPSAASVDVLDSAGAKVGSVDLPADVFAAPVNVALIHQVVVAQQAAARQGTHSTKSRGEVSGGGAKPYRQKGTGRARQGSIRAPQFAGGGVVHGPTPRRYDQRTPKKMKAAALRGALSDRASAGRLHVVASLVEGDVPSTKTALAALAKLTERPRVLVVLERGDDRTWLSLRNAPNVHLLAADQLNTYDVLVSDDVVFTQAAFESFVTRASSRATATTPVGLSDEVTTKTPTKAAKKPATGASAKAADKSPTTTKKTAADKSPTTTKKTAVDKASATTGDVELSEGGDR
jgi:large subunit ribosomal protein L4